MTESAWCENEGTIKFDTTDEYFANEIFTVWFSDFTKRFCSFVVEFIYLSPLHYHLICSTMRNAKN
ncbi:unnamed protein product, partial [Schistosoma rodhaini]